jgi:hypothetical protein
MGEQLIAAGGARPVLAVREEDVGSGREGPGRDGPGERVGTVVGVHADVRERIVEGVADTLADRLVESATVSTSGADGGLDVGMHASAGQDPRSGRGEPREGGVTGVRGDLPQGFDGRRRRLTIRLVRAVVLSLVPALAGHQISPARTAWATACERVRASSLVTTSCSTFFTVRSL